MTTLLMMLFLLASVAGGAVLGWLARARSLGLDDVDPVDRDAPRFAGGASRSRNGD